MESLLDPEIEALQTVLESGDERFVAILLEIMRARQIGIVEGSYNDIIETLESLSDQDFSQDWPAWIEWYGKTELEPPPGFTGWKGQLLARIDPGFADFLQDEFPSRIRVEEILWGGVPVSIAYCTLCGVAIAYDGRGPDGQTITFGTSGFLYRSNKLMYDRPTRTLWNQLTGEPVLAAEKVVNDTIGSTPVVLIAVRDTVTVKGLHRRSGPVTYTNGGEVRAFNRGEETFSAGPGPDSVFDSAGRLWQVTEEALLGPASTPE